MRGSGQSETEPIGSPAGPAVSVITCTLYMYMYNIIGIIQILSNTGLSHTGNRQ